MTGIHQPTNRIAMDGIAFGPWMHLNRSVDIPQCDRDGRLTFPVFWWSSEGKRVEVLGWLRENGWGSRITHYCLMICQEQREFWVESEDSAPFMATPVRGDEFAFGAEKPFGTAAYLKEHGIILPEESNAL